MRDLRAGDVRSGNVCAGRLRPGHLCALNVRPEHLLQAALPQVQVPPGADLLRIDLRAGDLRAGDLRSEAVRCSGPVCSGPVRCCLRSFDLRAEDLLQGTVQAPLPQGADLLRFELLRFDLPAGGVRPGLLRSVRGPRAGRSESSSAAAGPGARAWEEGLVKPFTAAGPRASGHLPGDVGDQASEPLLL